MIKLSKYLKPFIFGLILSIALLFGQAMSDLNLPNLMSDIVNVGIQQSGIEHAAPDAVSIDGMRFMTSLMTGEQREVVNSKYKLVSSSDADSQGKPYISIYPKAGEQLYIKGSVNKTEAAILDEAFEIAAAAFVKIIQTMSAQPGQQPVNYSATSTFDITKVYEMQPMIDAIPEETLEAVNKEAAESDSILIRQSGIMLSKAFHEELGFNIGKLQTGYILRIGMLMLLIALLGGIATILVGLLSSKIATGVARNLRMDLFNKVESFSNNELDKFSTASLITRCTNDVTQIQMLLLMGIRLVCYAPIMGVGAVIMAVNKSASMSWIIAVAVTVLLGMIMIVMSIALPKFKAIQKLIDRLNLVSRENLSGLMVIRAFGTQKYEKNRFDNANRDLTDTMLYVSRVMVFLMPAMMFIMNGVTVLIVWTGSHQIANTSMQIGDMIAFMQYAIQVIFSFLMISMMFIFVPRAAVSAERIQEVLYTDITILDPENPENFDESKKGLLEFKDVCFRYNGADTDAVCGITFTASHGKTTAIIGSTGSGKSTIAKLALRFYDVSKGSILVDGVDIREVKQSDLRNRIGYVPQKGVLLSGTIASNIKYGKQDATDDEIYKAAEISQSLEFINEKSENFDSEIAQGGNNVSGGQKQRLSIARALAKNPEILIFDDSFSALDFKTDQELRKALKKHTGDSTVIIVTQRVSTIINAEQIIVVENGRMAGIGTHRELLKNCPEYYEIASSQLSEEELL